MERVVIALLGVVFASTPAGAADWQRIQDFPLREINLTRDQSGVSYDEGSYKFFVSDQHFLRSN